MKLAKELRKRITKHQEMIRLGLFYMEAAQTYNKRKLIKLSDIELQEFVQIVKSEVMLVPVDAFCVDAFLEAEDARRAKLSRWERVKRAWRAADGNHQRDYRRFTQAVKRAMYQDGSHIGIKEEIDEEAPVAGEGVRPERQRGEPAHDREQAERVEGPGQGVADPDGAGHDRPDAEEAAGASREKVI